MSSVFLSKNHLPLDRPTYHFPESLALFKLKLAQALTVNENLRKEHFHRKYMSVKVFVAEIHLVWLRAGICDANSQPGGIGKDDHLILKSAVE